MRTLLALLALALPALAERYALLIGVDQYPKYAGITPLEGPSYDVAALEKMLRQKWNFTNIKILVNETAGHDNILNAIRQLTEKVRPGDLVVIHYSGHGTSFFDVATKGFGMGMRTGAVVPYDLGDGLTPPYPADKVLNQLIVGSKHLFPLFKELDAKADVIVFFDACFSGNSARAIPTLRPRSAPLANQIDLSSLNALVNSQVQQSVAKQDSDAWPYRNLVYFSAASRDEQAWEVGAAKIADGRKTFDNRPHGVFTDSLLRGLDGAADLDHNGEITYRELHAFIKGEIQTHDGQHPLLQGSEDRLARSVFGSKAPAPSRPQRASSLFRVRLAAGVPGMTERLRSNPRIQLTNGDFDLALESSGAACRLRHSSGSLYKDADIPCAEAPAMIERLAMGHALDNLAIPAQHFNMTIRLDPEGAGVYYVRDSVRVEISSDQSAWVGAINVDSEGGFRVLAVKKINAGRPEMLVDTDIVEPVGVEKIKLVGFLEEPRALTKWVADTGDKRVENIADLETLLSVLTRTAQSQTQMAVYTARRPAGR